MRHSNPIAVGDVFGRLTVLSEAPSSGYNRRWEVVCSCGSPKRVVWAMALKSGNTKGCGCTQLEGKHGMAYSPEYAAWSDMWQRCTNPNHKSYALYRGRVPTEEWRSFPKFLADMGLRPSAKFSLERVDNSLGYFKENCEWATRAKQNSNRSNNHLITIDGVTKILWDWLSFYGRDRVTFYRRVKQGWTERQALETPPGGNHTIQLKEIKLP